MWGSTKGSTLHFAKSNQTFHISLELFLMIKQLEARQTGEGFQIHQFLNPHI